MVTETDVWMLIETAVEMDTETEKFEQWDFFELLQCQTI